VLLQGRWVQRVVGMTQPIPTFGPPAVKRDVPWKGGRIPLPP
jgi:hypothetical protein